MSYGQYIYPATLLILLLEIAFGRHKGIYDRHTRKVTAACFLGQIFARPLVALLIAYIAAFLLPAWRGALATTPIWIAYPAVLMLSEFSFYWVHRWAHEAKGSRHDWLWKLHRAHHSGRFMNVGVTIRINAFWNFVVPTTWVIGIATYLGLEKGASLAIVTIYGWNLITHAHFRWDDAVRRTPMVGRLFRAAEHVLVSPGIHHSHHGYGKDGGNFRNYAVTFSWLDWLFGSLHIPEGRPWRYGIPGSDAHWAEEAFYPLYRERRGRSALAEEPN
jgi:sterol desaturase/sphingolipid hydroxylase (fatty acid hydroxylase superfamily)